MHKFHQGQAVSYHVPRAIRLFVLDHFRRLAEKAGLALKAKRP